MRGRPPKPRELHIEQGTLRIHRHGTEDTSLKFEKPSELEAPPHLNGLALKLWEKWAPHYISKGLLDEVSAYPFARWVQAEATVIELRARIEIEGDIIDGRKHPLYSVLRGQEDTANKLMQEFGATPASRARIRVENQQIAAEIDPLQKYA